MQRQFTTGLMVIAGVLIVLWAGPGPLLARAAATPNTASLIAQEGDWQCVEVNGLLEVNVRSGPGLAYAVVLALAPGSQGEADYARLQSADGYNWLPVRYASGEGWVITARLIPCQAPPAGATPSAPGDHLVLQDINRDGTLDRAEIAAVARSVVLVANVQNGRIVSTGTGTITTPDGQIVTNAHVVEDAEEVAIGILDDINDPPEYRYRGVVTGYDAEIDVALVTIRADIKGNPLDAASLNLPYLPASVGADTVFRGDLVYIFGYPGIGDDYLVVTSGSIVSVENGQVGSQRIPVWYRTDAELAPGNSGGLAVNGNGEFIGIPTFVRAETQTGGRLGGIRPTQIALMAVLDDAAALVETPPEQPPAVGTLPVRLTFRRVWMEHGLVVGGQPGIQLHIAFEIEGWAEQNATLTARFFHDTVASLPVTNPAAPAAYQDPSGGIAVSTLLTPCCDLTIYDDLLLFIPYSALGLAQPGTYPLKARLDLGANDGSWQRTLSWEFIRVVVE